MLLSLAALLFLQDPAPLVTLDSPHPWTAPADAAQWEARRAEVRRRVLVAAGLWPEPPACDLDFQSFPGTVRDGYVVHPVAFQALPGFWVTGSLYRPTRSKGPWPGVLCPHGHWAQGRFTVIDEGDARGQIERAEERFLANAQHHLQARCAQLARMGCVVLHYDMIGYADSRQLDHHHGFGDAEAELWGLSHFGLQTLSSIRALDALLAFPNVDPERIGVTGASGGGTQTFVLAAVDDRPDVLFPAVMVSTAMQGGCVCENASHLRVGSGNIELAAMAAPRPLGLTGANDWTLEIESKGLPELRRLYARLGVPDRVEAWCYPTFEHNYNLVSRTRMYEWFDRYLGLGLAPPLVEQELEPLAPADLAVWRPDRARPDGALDTAGVRAWWFEHARAGRDALWDSAGAEPERFRAVVGGALATIVAPRTLPSVPTSEGGAPTVLVVVADAADAPELDVPHELYVEHRAAPPVDAGRHRDYVGYTWCYNRTWMAERAGDVLAEIARLTEERGRPVRVVGLGAAAPSALLAAALAGDAVESLAVDACDFEHVRDLADPALLPRAAQVGDAPAFAALLAPRPLLWMGASEVPRAARGLYAAEGAPGAAEIGGRDALAAWTRRP